MSAPVDAFDRRRDLRRQRRGPAANDGHGADLAAWRLGGRLVGEGYGRHGGAGGDRHANAQAPPCQCRIQHVAILGSRLRRGLRPIVAGGRSALRSPCENARVIEPHPSRFSLVDTAGPAGALRLLFWLRMVAIGSQIAAIAAAHFVLAGPLPLRELGLAVGALALWNALNYGPVHAQAHRPRRRGRAASRRRHRRLHGRAVPRRAARRTRSCRCTSCRSRSRRRRCPRGSRG